MVCSKINNNVLYSCIYKKGHSSAFLFEILSPITVILRRAKPTWLPQFRYKINYAENLDVGEYVTMFKFAFCIQQGYDLFTLVNISWLTVHTHMQKCPKWNCKIYFSILVSTWPNDCIQLSEKVSFSVPSNLMTVKAFVTFAVAILGFLYIQLNISPLI